MNGPLYPRAVLWMCAMSVVLRLALLFVSPMDSFGKYEQLVLAKNVVTGYGLNMMWPYPPADPERQEFFANNPAPYPSAFMPPFVPSVFAAAFAVFGVGDLGMYSVLVLQCLVGGLIPLLVFRIGKRLGSERQALIAAGVSLLYLPGLLASATPAGAVWYCVFGLLAVDLAQTVPKRPKHFWILGVVLGFLALMRSEFLMIGAALAMLPLLRRDWRTPLKTLLVMGLVVSPWLIRNAIEFGKPVGIISHPWREIWRGANLDASGSGYDATGIEIWEGKRFPEIVRKLDSIPLSRTFELDADAVFKTEVLGFIAAHPMRFVFLSLKKMGMLWSIDVYYPKAKSLAYILPTLLTSLLILAGLGFSTRSPTSVLPFIIVLGCLTGLFAITYVLPRYQVFVFTIGLPLIACIPFPTFASSRWHFLRMP